MNLEQIGETLRAAIRKARAEGIAIRPGAFGSRAERQACPLGCMHLDSTDSVPEKADIIESKLGIMHGEAAAIARGFDGTPLDDPEPITFLSAWEYHALGATLRSEVDRGEL